MRGLVFDIEEWRDAVGFEEYISVSSLGRARFKERVGKNGRVYPEREIRMVTSDGYSQSSINIDGKKTTLKMHRLVAQAFIPNPENKPQVNHINSLRKDNRVSNLEWVTVKENVIHSYKSGFNSNTGELHPRAILTEKVVCVIRRLNYDGYTTKEISDMLGYKYHTVHKVVSGLHWKGIGELE